MSRSPYLHALELLAAARAGRDSQPECSVTVSRNFKHDYTFEVVVRGPSVTDCRLLAEYEVDALAAKYPAGGSVSPQDAPLDLDVSAAASRRSRPTAVTT